MNEEPVYSPQGMGGTVRRIEAACWDEPRRKKDSKRIEGNKKKSSEGDKGK